MTVTAVLAAALAAGCLLPPRRSAPPRRPGGYRWPRPDVDLLRHRWALAMGAALLVVPAGPALALAVGIVVAAVVPGLADAVAARSVGRLRSGWQAALGAIAVALRAAVPPADALLRGADAAAGAGMAELGRSLDRVGAEVRLGAEPAAALTRRFPQGPGAALGAALGLAADLGAPAATLATRLAAQAVAATRSRQAIDVELSGARATVHLLAALPLAGLALAAAFGASAPAYLLSTRPGHACLLAAACFEAAGLTWTRRLLRAVA